MSQYVVISSHAQVGETFVFIKKQIAGQEAPYIVHFEDESVHTNLEGDSTSTSAPNSGVSFDWTLPSLKEYAEDKNANAAWISSRPLVQHA
jgi:hypothetical protein